MLGDAGPDGDRASGSVPGYVVEVPYRGSPFRMSITGQSIVFPRALAVNNINGDLVIGDGGDEATAAGQVVEVPPSGPALLVTADSPDPTGLAFDAAGDLYVLDGMTNVITEMLVNGTSAALPIANGSSLWAPSAMATSAGTQSFVVANLGGGSDNELVVLNGNSATLQFSGSAAQAVTIANIGNQTLTLSNASKNKKDSFYNPDPLPSLTLSTSDTCASGDNLTAASAWCVFSLQATKSGAINDTATIHSNAYNSGSPVISLQETELVKVKANDQKATPNAVANKGSKQKSFAAAKAN